jgi:hypothetical protein
LDRSKRRIGNDRTAGDEGIKVPVSSAMADSASTRKKITVYLFLVTSAGFLAKFYSGPGQAWVRDYGAGVLYEIFWCLVFFLVWPRRQATRKIAAGVFFGTSFLEVLQLWRPWFLEQIRSTFLGSALIGTTFVWWDFPHYALGCLIGWLWMRSLDLS